MSSDQDQRNLIQAEKHGIDVRLVLVDIIATDKKGNFVKDLSMENFLVFEDRRKVAINSLDLINYEILKNAYHEKNYQE